MVIQAAPEETEALLDKAVLEIKSPAPPLGRHQLGPSRFLIEEITSGLLHCVQQDSPGLYLAYERRAPSMECGQFRLIPAASRAGVLQHLGIAPQQASLTIRLVQIRYPGQLVGAERFFATRIEDARNLTHQHYH